MPSKGSNLSIQLNERASKQKCNAHALRAVCWSKFIPSLADVMLLQKITTT